MTGPAEALDLPSFGDRQNLRERAARALRAALVTGQMRPGVVYSAPALARRFSVSSTPVREALLDLAKEGLVEAVPNKGYRVLELSERKLDEITEIRALIEIPTVARLAGRVGAAQLAELRPLAQAIEDAAATGDLIAYIEADRQFHVRLLGNAGNDHLVHVVEDLRARSRLYGLRRLAERGALVESAREHHALLDLVASGDADAARALMARHIAHVRGSWATGQ